MYTSAAASEQYPVSLCLSAHPASVMAGLSSWRVGLAYLANADSTLVSRGNELKKYFGWDAIYNTCVRSVIQYVCLVIVKQEGTEGDARALDSQWI